MPRTRRSYEVTPSESLGRQIARALIKIGLERMDQDDLEQVLGAVVSERSYRQALEAERLAAPWRQRRRAKEARKAALKPHRDTLRALGDLAFKSPEMFERLTAELLDHANLLAHIARGPADAPPAPPPAPAAGPTVAPCGSAYPAEMCRCAKCRELLGRA